jgi:predicted DNA-binding antitoxin AbrB/MazE fold protein
LPVYFSFPIAYPGWLAPDVFVTLTKSRSFAIGVLLMPITVEATYENGVLKPARALPLREKERVQVTIHSPSTWVERTAGLMGFTGTAEEADYFALAPELDPQED